MELLKLPELQELTSELKLLLYALVALGVKQLAEYIKRVTEDKNKLFVWKRKKSTEIDERLTNLRFFLKADRAAVFEFSNTEESLPGIGFSYLHMTYESVNRKKVSAIAKFFNKVHVSLYPFTLTKLDIPEERYKLYHVDDPNIPQEIRDMMEQFGVQSTLMYRLHKNKLMYGTLSVNWHDDFYRTLDDEHRPKNLSYEDELEIRDAAEFILKSKQKPHWWQISMLNKKNDY